MKSALSLKGRALQCLAQREHSRVELRRKLLEHAPTCEAEIDAVLAWMSEHGHLSEERFVESRIHARASRFGNLRIRVELLQHGMTLTHEAARALEHSELARARDVWQRKFAAVPHTLAERSRQVRFLAGRGFSSDVIGSLLREMEREARHHR